MEELFVIQNFVARPPRWIFRWGITIIVSAIIGIIVLSSLISYPDVIVTEGQIVLENAPVEITSETSGDIVYLNISDKAQIKKGNLIMVVKDASNWRDVLYLDSFINQTGTIPTNKELKLGELILPFQTARLSALQEEFTVNSDITDSKINSTKDEINKIHDLNNSMARQVSIYSDESKNYEKDNQRQKKLLSDGVISEQDYEKSENVFLQMKRQIETIKSNIINNNIRIVQLESNLVELKKNRQDNFFSRNNTFQQNLQSLKTALALWKKRQLIIAQTDGELVFEKPFQTGSYIKSNDLLGKIIPSADKLSSAEIFGFIPTKGAAKVVLGQKADFILDDYPEKDYGVLQSIVSYIAPAQNEKKYKISVKLPSMESWATSFNKSIPKKQNLTGSLRIYTKNYTLLSRMINLFIMANN